MAAHHQYLHLVTLVHHSTYCKGSGQGSYQRKSAVGRHSCFMLFPFVSKGTAVTTLPAPPGTATTLFTVNLTVSRYDVSTSRSPPNGARNPQRQVPVPSSNRRCQGSQSSRLRRPRTRSCGTGVRRKSVRPSQPVRRGASRVTVL